MSLFIASIVTVLVVSAFCSLAEAGLYAVRLPYVRQLVDQGSVAGEVLLKFKQDIQRPIAAILILNTVANTAGAAIAGAQARALFGESALIWFAVMFTVGVLFLSEILPKVIGVTYNRIVAPLVSVPLQFVLLALTPVVWLTEAATRAVRRTPPPVAPEDEVHQMATISAEEGSILPVEAGLVQNVLRLNEVKARHILTPRNVVFKLPAGQPVSELREAVGTLPFARIPVHDDDDPDHWLGVVLRRDIIRCLAQGQHDVTIRELTKPIHFVPETILGHTLLSEFLRRRAHLFGVLDEYGNAAGVVTLEDVLESLLGEEIVDETDTSVDLQAEARARLSELLDAQSPGEQDSNQADRPPTSE
jgi:CBS domain containing-hemolysin-like protein